MPQPRHRVVCENCDWAGRRTESGGPCPECGSAVVFASQRAPSPRDGLRQRVVAHLAPGTVKQLETARKNLGLRGIGTAASMILDSMAEDGRLKRWIKARE